LSDQRVAASGASVVYMTTTYPEFGSGPTAR
jgi:hypothetical protein